MASFHRVLEAFGRATSDNDIQCDCDIHPWDISINGTQWSGKIRLVAFIDVFFLLCYSNNSRIEQGIIIYKYQDNVDKLLKDSKVSVDFDNESGETAPLSSPKLERADSAVSGISSEKTQTATPPLSPAGADDAATTTAAAATAAAATSPENQPGDSVFSSDSTFYKVSGRGHKIGLKLRYPTSDWKRYTIEIRKQGDPLKNRRMKRGLKKHDTLDLLEDSAKIGIISAGEVTGHATGHLVMGGFLEDTGRKYIEGVTSGQRSKNMTLSGDT